MVFELECSCRSLPSPTRYSRPSIIVPLAGILPFGSIFIEMYFILTSLWGYMYYYVYGFVLLVFAILVVVLVCTTIVAVYFVLNGEVRAQEEVAGVSCFVSSGRLSLSRARALACFCRETSLTSLLCLLLSRTTAVDPFFCSLACTIVVLFFSPFRSLVSHACSLALSRAVADLR